MYYDIATNNKIPSTPCSKYDNAIAVLISTIQHADNGLRQEQNNVVTTNSTIHTMADGETHT